MLVRTQHLFNAYIVNAPLVFQGPLTKCTACNGLGTLFSQVNMGNGLQVIQKLCGMCKGTKEICSILCTKCKGQRLFQNKKILEVFVEKGMAEGQIIKFRGEADQEFGKDAGDVVIVLIVKDHDKFTRKGGGRRSFIKQAMVIYYD